MICGFVTTKYQLLLGDTRHTFNIWSGAKCVSALWNLSGMVAPCIFLEFFGLVIFCSFCLNQYFKITIE